MDSNNVEEAILLAWEQKKAGNPEAALAILLPLWNARKEKTMSPDEELAAVSILRDCNLHRGAQRAKLALPYAHEAVRMAQPRSEKHATALRQLGVAQTWLKQFQAARESYVESLAVLNERGVPQDAHTAMTVASLGVLEDAQGNYESAMKFYCEARKIFEHSDLLDHMAHADLLDHMAQCYEKLHIWDQSYVCRKECVAAALAILGPNHQIYVKYLTDFAFFHTKLRQFTTALSLFDDATALIGNVRGENAGLMRSVAKMRTFLASKDFDVVGHPFRMCNKCCKVDKIERNFCSGCCKVWYCNADCQRQDWPLHKEHCGVHVQCTYCGKFGRMDMCRGCSKAWYCGADCQLQHWEAHKADCSVCIVCSQTMEHPKKIQYCSCCKEAKYCGAECQLQHWSEHRKDCTKAKPK